MEFILKVFTMGSHHLGLQVHIEVCLDLLDMVICPPCPERRQLQVIVYHPLGLILLVLYV